MPVIHAATTTGPIDRSRLEALVSNTYIGARVNFTGLTRDRSGEVGGAVIELDYTCYPDVDRFLVGVVASVASGLDPEGKAVLVVKHRIGSLGVRKIAIVTVTTSVHRDQAFKLCRTLVDRARAEVPTWRHQHEESGRTSWSNLRLSQ